MEEVDAFRVSAVLATNADLYLWIYFTCFIDADLHQLAYTLLISGLQWIIFQYFLININWQECALGIVSTKPHPGLCEVICAKLKKSHSFAISSAVRAARGISIIVPYDRVS